MRKLFPKLACAIFLFFCVPFLTVGQNLRHVKQFYAVNGNVQFLPGAYVIVTEYGDVHFQQDAPPVVDKAEKKRYKWEGAQFVAVKGPLAPELENWVSFDSVDFLNQIDLKDFDPDLEAFLPRSRKVKKVLSISFAGKKQLLELICYLKGRNLFLTGVIDTDPYKIRPGKFQKLWTQMVKSDADYGDFQVQDVPTAGKFALLYTAATNGHAVNIDLDVFQLTDN